MAVAQRPVPQRRRGGVLGLLALALVVALAVAWLAGLLPSLNPFGTETRDRTGPAVLKALDDLSEYRAATANLELVVDVEKDVNNVPSFIKGERTLFVAAGSVDAAVDFGGLDERAVKVSSDRRAVEITLPRPRLTDARVDPARSRVFDRKRGLLDRVGSVFEDNPTEERGLYLLAQRRLAAAARDPKSGLIERAEVNTRSMLSSLLRSLGFRKVTVRFVEPGGGL